MVTEVRAELIKIAQTQGTPISKEMIMPEEPNKDTQIDDKKLIIKLIMTIHIHCFVIIKY